MLFVGIRGYLTAFDMAVPRRLWTVNLKNTGWRPVSMLLSENILYVVTHNVIYAYNALDGIMRWSFSHNTVGRVSTLAKLGEHFSMWLLVGHYSVSLLDYYFL